MKPTAYPHGVNTVVTFEPEPPHPQPPSPLPFPRHLPTEGGTPDRDSLRVFREGVGCRGEGVHETRLIVDGVVHLCWCCPLVLTQSLRGRGQQKRMQRKHHAGYKAMRGRRDEGRRGQEEEWETHMRNKHSCIRPSNVQPWTLI